MDRLIDRTALHSNTGGDAELANEVLEIFKGQIETWGKMLDVDADPKVWADAAHTIKGSALGVGANKLADACKAAETGGRADPPVSKTEGALLLNDIRDFMLPTLEEVASIQHEILNSGTFRLLR